MKRIIKSLFLIIITFSLLKTNSFAELPTKNIDIFQIKTIEFEVNKEKFTWNIKKYGDYIILGYGGAMVPVEPFAEKLGFKYEKIKIKSKEFIKLWRTDCANIIYFPIVKTLDDSGYEQGYIKNGKLYISVKNLDFSMYKINDNIDRTRNKAVYKSKISIETNKHFLDLNKYSSIIPKEQLLFENRESTNETLISIVKPFIDKSTGLVDYKILGRVRAYDGNIRFQYAPGSSEESTKTQDSIKEFVKIFLNTKVDIDNEYFKYFGNDPIDDKDLLDFDKTAKETNPYYDTYSLKFSSMSSIAYFQPCYSEPSNIEGFQVPWNFGEITKMTKAQVENQIKFDLRKDEKLNALFDEHLAKYPEAIFLPYHIQYNNKKYDFYKTGNQSLEGTGRMLLKKSYGIYFTQKDTDVKWVEDRSLFELRRDGSVWGSYAIYPEKDAVSISLKGGIKNYAELGKQLIDYTSGKSGDGEEVYKLYNQVMIAYLNYRVKVNDDTLKTGAYTGYEFAQTNKVYKLKSGTIIYLDMNGWYDTSDGPTVYIKKNLKDVRDAYFNGTISTFYGEYIRAESYLDAMNVYFEPENFSWNNK